MSSAEAWSQVALDIWHVLKYIAPPGLWMILPRTIESDDVGAFWAVGILAVALTYVSYQ